ncbi:MAG: DNA adenine methylase [Chloroflexota bacterium]|nr:DNA adenine methylase [Chloroflexota bacterium]
MKTFKKKTMPNGRSEEIESWKTEGGVLHWGKESGPDMDWFRAEIRKAYGGQAPKVLDPFAGGGAIPLEAMRLGCEVTAADINPVAWFILKCTLEYPQKLAGKKRKLPGLALLDSEFMAAYLKSSGLKPAQVKRHLRQLRQAPISKRQGTAGESADWGENFDLLQPPDLDPELLFANLSWHVRAWGRWVLKEVRRDLARLYPTYAEFCSVKPYGAVTLDSGEPLKLVPIDGAGEPQADLLNTGFENAYLENPANPRWVAKPTVAYLWARTAQCKACRATVPLLKTCWLAKKDNKRVLLKMQPLKDESGVEFDIDKDVEARGGNAAQRREHDRQIGAGTMSRAGVTCPCCGTIMTMNDLRLEGRAGRRGVVMTAVVTEGLKGKEYRLPTNHEVETAHVAEKELDNVYADLPFGMPTEPIVRYGKPGGSYGFPIVTHGISQWNQLFTHRQLMTLGAFVRALRRLADTLNEHGFGEEWCEAIIAYNAIVFNKTADYGSALCTWHNSGEKMRNTFARFALPMAWDIAELAIINDVGGTWLAQLDWVARYIEHGLAATDRGTARTSKRSVINGALEEADIIVTDPPYYDAIPYSDLMDFFHVWLRRTLNGVSPELEAAFAEPLSPKWDLEANDGELIDDASRFRGDKEASKSNYETGMARAFSSCHTNLKPEGRLVIVFAHKQPDAWETLVGAIVKAGFVVDASWPIQTEMGTRMRAFSSAALSSSVWLVCRKRDPVVRAGWDKQVVKEMESNIIQRLRDFWDAGIRGPDFVWAATGPALEAYSRYPVVKKASEPGVLMGVDEFLRHVRRIVVDFVVGRVLTRDSAEAASGDHALDDITTYYLLHRNDFGLKKAPAGACILYMVSCGLSERDLINKYGLLAKGGKRAAEEDTAGDDAESETARGGSQFRLKRWSVRRHRSLGEDSASGRPPPLIDQAHKLLHLWKAGDVIKVNNYLDRRGLRHSQVFAQLVQALIEKSRDERQDDERALLERLANHLRIMGSAPQTALMLE